jgi:hypothetical protein
MALLGKAQTVRKLSLRSAATDTCCNRSHWTLEIFKAIFKLSKSSAYSKRVLYLRHYTHVTVALQSVQLTILHSQYYSNYDLYSSADFFKLWPCIVTNFLIISGNKVKQQPANRTHNPQLHTIRTTWKPKHQIPQAASNCIILSSSWWWA